MKVELEKTFPMPGTTAASWEFLQNIEGVAGCMPGAKITERLDEAHYKGTISVRVGPAGMSFKGEIEVQALEPATRTLHLVGKGSDTSGTSGASMDLVARIEPGATQGTSNLIGRSEVTMSGKAAAFGGRMMGSVADQILKQFAANFAVQVQARAAAGSAASAGTATSAPATGMGNTVFDTAPATAAAGMGNTMFDNAPAGMNDTTSDPAAPTVTSVAAPRASAIAGTGAGASSAVDPLPSTTQPSSAADPMPYAALPSTAPPTPAPANELNALALFWAILRDWFRGLFRRKPA
jgi:carbon monoxide dehydrogenase subunit G